MDEQKLQDQERIRELNEKIQKIENKGSEKTKEMKKKLVQYLNFNPLKWLNFPDVAFVR